MGKAEAGSAKSIANAIKAKGLGRLRWYCQVCEKQCRDENGFQAHIKSEPHLRKILSVGPKAGATIAQFSQNFQYEFVLLLRTRHTTNRVQANKVYNEYIQDKHHVHMNATRWVTLGGFVAHLGKEGIVRVDEDEKGLWIQWIDNSPATLQRQAAILKRDRAQMDGEERDRLVLQEQIERAREQEAAAAAASAPGGVGAGGAQNGTSTGTATSIAAGAGDGLLKRDGEKIGFSFSFGGTSLGGNGGNAASGPSSAVGTASQKTGGDETPISGDSGKATSSTPGIPTNASTTIDPTSSSAGQATLAAPIGSGISISTIPAKPKPVNVFKTAAKKRARDDDGTASTFGGGESERAGGGKKYESAAERLMREDQARKMSRGPGGPSRGGGGGGYSGQGPMRTQAHKSRF